MTIDSISDMATIIRNAITIKNSLVTLPYTKNNEIIAKILAKEGFIHCVTTTNKTNQDSQHYFQKNQKFSENNFDDISLHDSRKSSKTTTSLDSSRPSFKENQINEFSERSPVGEFQNEAKGRASENEKISTIATNNINHSIENPSKNRFQSSVPSNFKSTRMNQKVIILALKYTGREKKPMIHAIKRISKPSLRWYSQSPIPQSLGGLGIFIVSTSYGIITDKEARDKKLGGEILLEIW